MYKDLNGHVLGHRIIRSTQPTALETDTVVKTVAVFTWPCAVDEATEFRHLVFDCQVL